MKFAITIPSGPQFMPTVATAFRSIAAQKNNVAVALCDVSDAPEIHSFADQYDDLISYRRHGQDAGQSAAINEGWLNIAGDIYGWLNVDDFLAPNAMEIVSNHFEKNPDVDVIYGQSLIIKDGKIRGRHSAVEPMSDLIFRSNIISQPSCFVRRKALFDVGLLDEDLHYVMDWELWVRLFEGGAKFMQIPDVLSCVLWHEDAKTASLDKKRYAEIRSVMSGRASWKQLWVSQTNFLIEHFADYGMAQPVFRKIRSGLLNMHKGTTVKAPNSTEIFHYEETEKNLKIELGRPMESTLFINKDKVGQFSGDLIELSNSFLPGTVYKLKIKNSANQPIGWQSLEFC